MTENTDANTPVWWELGPRIESSKRNAALVLGGNEARIGIAKKDAWIQLWSEGPATSDEITMRRDDLGALGGYPLEIDWDQTIPPNASASVWTVSDADGLGEAIRGLVSEGMQPLAGRIHLEKLTRLIDNDDVTVIAARSPDSRRASGLLAFSRQASVSGEGGIEYYVSVEHFSEPGDASVRAALIGAFGLQVLADNEALAASLHANGVPVKIEQYCGSGSSENEDLASELAEMVDYVQEGLFGWGKDDRSPAGFDWNKADFPPSVLVG